MEIFQVEDILDYRAFEGKPHFLIKWRNYSHNFDTWQPIDHLSNAEMQLKLFMANFKPSQTSSTPSSNFKHLPQVVRCTKSNKQSSSKPLKIDIMKNKQTINRMKQSCINLDSSEEESDTHDCFDMIGQIDQSHILKIVRVFRWGDISCATVHLITGNRVNIKITDLNRICPSLLAQFYKQQS